MKRNWIWARNEIARLNPEADAQRLAHLSFEVRYGTPIFLHALFNIAFVYNMGIPATASILYRDGRGPIMRQTRKRNFDSMIFFGELYRHGGNEKGRAICERLNRIHSNFAIPNELSLYTLATLACLPYRIGHRFAPRLGPSAKEYQAQYFFWCRIGELLQIQNIPASLASFLEWMRRYEEQNFKPTPAATAVIQAMQQEWAEYWFGPALRPLAHGLFLHLIEPRIRRKLGLADPSPAQQHLGNAMIQGFFLGKSLLPDPSERSMVSFFSQHYPAHTQLDNMGIDAGSKRSVI